MVGACGRTSHTGAGRRVLGWADADGGADRDAEVEGQAAPARRAAEPRGPRRAGAPIVRTAHRKRPRAGERLRRAHRPAARAVRARRGAHAHGELGREVPRARLGGGAGLRARVAGARLGGPLWSRPRVRQRRVRARGRLWTMPVGGPRGSALLRWLMERTCRPVRRGAHLSPERFGRAQVLEAGRPCVSISCPARGRVLRRASLPSWLLLLRPGRRGREPPHGTLGHPRRVRSALGLGRAVPHRSQLRRPARL